MKKYLLPIIIAVLIALALLFGFINRNGRLLGSNTLSKNKEVADRSLSDYYQTAENLKTQNIRETSFLAVGDIMLSRNVAGMIKKSGDSLLVFKKSADLLSSADFNFGNLESPLSGRDDFNPTGSLVFNAPPAYAKG